MPLLHKACTLHKLRKAQLVLRLWSGRRRLWLDGMEREVRWLLQSWRDRLAGCAVSSIIIHPAGRPNVNPGRVVIEMAAGDVRRRFHAG